METNWKAPPPDRTKMWINKSLEMQILLACNWRCIACDQGSQFPSFDFVRRGTMTIFQVMYFIDEMKNHNAYLGRIRLLGGEPTVHPKFAEIVELLYHALVPDYVGCLEVISNGSNPAKLKAVAQYLSKARVSGERQKQGTHVANFIHTPASLGYEGTVCSAPWHCGISLNTYGYFPCSSGAGIARFEDWMKWQRLGLPLCNKPGNAVRETWPDLQELCGHCYHGLKDADKVRCGTKDPERNKPGGHIDKQLQEWKEGKKVEWKTYGERGI